MERRKAGTDIEVGPQCLRPHLNRMAPKHPYAQRREALRTEEPVGE